MTTEPVRQQPDALHDRLIARLEATDDLFAVAAALNAALDVCRMYEQNSLRWQDQLPVPAWVHEIREDVATALGVAW